MAEDAASEKWPRRVLITNDNGIEDVKIVELARAFSGIAETYVVASLTDRSGTSNLTSIGSRKPWVEVEKRDLGPGIFAYGLDGYPADCVMWAALGPLHERPADLVVSGINGGPNLGSDWFGSGTVGAARTAAFGGIPAIAVSGLDQSIPGALQAACRWVVQLAQSEIVKNLKSGQYLTVSIPRVPPADIRGVAIASRAGLDVNALPRMVPVEGEPRGPRQRWVMQQPLKETPATADILLYHQKKIVIVPMHVNEVDDRNLDRLQRDQSLLPVWPVKKMDK